MFTVAILAGGLATRLRPITETVPKALVNVAGKPFIARQLEYLAKQGAYKVVICVGYLGEMIEELVGNGESYGLQVNYSFDGAKLRGTGGALKLAIPLLSEHFFVLYGDSFLPVNFRAIQLAYESSSDPALMTVFKNEGRWDNSNVMFVDGRLIEYNKPAPRSGMNYIDYGLGLLSKSVLDNYTTDNPIDLSEIYHQLSIKGQLQGFEVHERFYEIGSHSGLKEAEEYFLTKEKI